MAFRELEERLRILESRAGDLQRALAAAEARAVPTGAIELWASASIAAPAGWLLCTGAAISRTEYADLFAVIGTTYGAGNGSTTFNLPNFIGRMPVGYDPLQTEFNAMGKTGGAKTHTLTQPEMPVHTHGNNAHSHGVGGSGSAFVANGSGGGSANVSTGGGGYQLAGPQPANIVIHNAGGGGAHNNMPPYLAARFIIRT